MNQILVLLNLFTFTAASVLFARCWPYRKILAIRYLILFNLSFCLITFFSLQVLIALDPTLKALYSTLRFLGFAILSPAALLYFAYVLKGWQFLYRPWFQIIIFVPGFITVLTALGLIPNQTIITQFESFEFLGIQTVRFVNGTWFPYHYIWSSFLTFMIFFVFISSFLEHRKEKLKTFLLSIGVIIGFSIDAFCVLTNSPYRWIMLSAGTYSITAFCILYVTQRYGLFKTLALEQTLKQDKMLFQERLLALISHDLFGNIHHQANLSRLLIDEVAPNQKNIAETLASSTEASQRLLDNILTWSKTLNEQLQPLRSEIDVDSLLEECLKQIQTAIEKKNIRIEIHFSNQPFILFCDKEMMASVFRNLILNAIQATPHEGTIRIDCDQDAKNSTISIKDHGVGMSPEQIEQISHNSSRIQNANGYGVGLSLVKYFIHIHSGDFRIDSKLNYGTQIYFKIPR